MTKPLLTHTSARVARVFLGDPYSEHYGVEIYQNAGIAPGTVYPMLDEWKARGWLTNRPETQAQAEQRRAKGPLRRYWKLTEKGLSELTSYIRRWDARQGDSRVR